jgi:hypothetical protein
MLLLTLCALGSYLPSLGSDIQVSDCLMDKSSIEYGGANPVFAGYVADTILAHNTFKDSAYSSICAGWGWGMASFMRNVHIVNNQVMEATTIIMEATTQRCAHCALHHLTPHTPIRSYPHTLIYHIISRIHHALLQFIRPMRRLADGGGIYTNT